MRFPLALPREPTIQNTFIMCSSAIYLSYFANYLFKYFTHLPIFWNWTAGNLILFSHSVAFPFLFFYVFERQTDAVLLPAGSFFKCLQQPGLGQAPARSQEHKHLKHNLLRPGSTLAGCWSQECIWNLQMADMFHIHSLLKRSLHLTFLKFTLYGKFSRLGTGTRFWISPCFMDLSNMK